MYKRLQTLVSRGYLRRVYLHRPLAAHRGGGPVAAYCLTARSARVVATITEYPLRQIQSAVKANDVQAPFLAHALEVNRFHVTLELACRRSGGRVRLIGWYQGQILRDRVTARSATADTQSYTVYPDACFALETTMGRPRLYFLEIDRGTMPITSGSQRSDIRKKLIGYMLYRREGLHRRRYAYERDIDAQKIRLEIRRGYKPDHLGYSASRRSAPGFNVLFVMPGSLTAAGEPAGRMGNVISVTSGMGREFATSSLFWFTSPGAYSVQAPASLLGRIWRSSHQGMGLQRLHQ